MKRALLAAAMLASACSDGGNNSAEVAEAPDVPVTVPEPTTTAPLPPEPTTTLAPSAPPEVEVTTTLPAPILCAELSHPEHHDPCPVATSAVPRQQSARPTVPVTSGWSIPTYIVMCESGGDWNAYNASGASGPYQLMPMHFGGELAMHQSRAAQHAKAAELWDGGNGKSHWRACL